MNRQPLALGFIFAVILLDLVGLTLLIPVTPYIVGQYSASALVVTLMTGVYAAAQFVAAPVLGRLSDRYGRRPVLLTCILGSAFGYFLFGVGGALWVLFLSRLIDGLTGGNISAASAYIADITPPYQRAKNFGLLGAAFGLGFILGPMLGGLLSQVAVNAPAYAAGVASLLGAAIGYFVLPESLPPDKRERGAIRWREINSFAVIAELLRRPELRPLLVVQAALDLVTTGFNSAAPLIWMRRFGVQPVHIAGLLVLVGVSSVVVQGGLMGRLVRRFGERNLAVGGLAFQALGVVGTTLLPFFWMNYLLQGVSVTGAGPVRPALGALLANRVTAQDQGKLNGVSTALRSLMAVFGPLGYGLAYDHLSPAAPFWAGGLLLLLASLWLAGQCCRPVGLVDRIGNQG